MKSWKSRKKKKRRKGKEEDFIWLSFLAYFDFRNVIFFCVVFSGGGSSFNRCIYVIFIIFVYKDVW